MLDEFGDWIDKNASEELGSLIRARAKSLHEWIQSVIDTQFSAESKSDTKYEYVSIEIPKKSAKFFDELFRFVEIVYNEFMNSDTPDDYKTILFASYVIIGDFIRAAFEHSDN